MKEYILAHDVGTGGCKSVLVRPDGRAESKVFVPYATYYPAPGWAEQDPQDWWVAVSKGTRMLIERTGISPAAILCVTFSTQQLGIVPMGSSGEPLRRAIIWMDNRAEVEARRAMKRFGGPVIFAAIAGTPLSGKDGIPKLLWLKRREPETYAKMVCFLDVGGYLLYRTTGQMAMELSGAAVFGLDLKRKTWLTGIMSYVGLDPKKLPPLVRSTDIVGKLGRVAASECGLLEGTPVVAGAGDAPAAAVGAGAVEDGDGHVYLGTSAWVSFTTNRTFTGRYGAVVIQAADPEKNFLHAQMENAGGCVRWFTEQFYRDLPGVHSSDDLYSLFDEDVGKSPAGAKGLLFTPWIFGERVPFTDTFVRGAFLNLSAQHSRPDLARAILEGVAYNLAWTLESVERAFGFFLPRLRVAGGGALSSAWMQILANVTGRPVDVLADPQEVSAVGAALTAAVGLGRYPNFASLKKLPRIVQSFEPQGGMGETYAHLLREYRVVYRRLRPVYRRLNREGEVKPPAEPEMSSVP
ncbi:MAG: xylulokinase [Bacillota bacterium]|jgi:xylulokinase|nr:xylulokinase [Bacillota bacterium]MDK2960751.1 xylulokinase [Bacillota bacterium]